MIKITGGRGFQMTFNNGVTISVQFGSFNYCENKTVEWTPEQDSMLGSVGCINAEIAIWDKNDNWYNFGAGNVEGWVTPDEIAGWIVRAREWDPTSGDIQTL